MLAEYFKPKLKTECTSCHLRKEKQTHLLQVLICANFKGMKIKPGSMGKPSPTYDVKVLYLWWHCCSLSNHFP